MRILHFFRSPIGGIFRHVRDLIGEQKKAGHEIGIICDSLTGGAYEDRLFEEIRPALTLGLYRIAIPRSLGPQDVSALFQSVRLVRSIGPDVVHTHAAKGGIHGRFAGWMASSAQRRVKRFYCPHGGALHYDPASLKGKVFFAAERFMERFTDSLVFVSAYEKNTYHEKVGRPGCAEAVVYNGLAEAEFEPVPAEPGAADFLYIGMMRDLKGPDVFLDALAQVSRERANPVSAMFVGDGPDKPAYLEKINALGLADRVSVHAAMPARQAFGGAQTVIVPSRAESMPYLVLEAIAAHKPVIATRVGGIPEIFAGREDRLVAPGDAGALAQAMAAQLDAPMPEDDVAGFAQALKGRFSLPVMAQGVERLYRA